MKRFANVLILVSIFSSCKLHSHYADNYSKDKTYHLRLNPKPGTSYYYDIENDSKIKISLDNNEVENISKSDVGINYSIGKDSLGDILLGISYDKIHVYSRNNGNETDADAENAKLSLNPTERMLGILKNASLTAVVTSKGEVKDIKGYRQLSSQLMAGLDTSDVNVKQVAQAQLDKMIGSQIIQKNLDQLFKIFPDSAIHVGDKWKMNVAQKGDFTLNVESEFHLEDINSEIAFVRSESEIEDDHAPLAMMGYTVIPNLKGTQKASYEIEAATGMLLNSNIESEISGKLQMLGREIPISLKVKVTIKGQRREQHP